MIKHKNAFAPFSLGSEGCIGKNCTSTLISPVLLSLFSSADNSASAAVAYIEMRTLTAQLLLDYDVSFAPGEDGKRLLTETKDHFTLGLGKLDLVFTPARA